MLFGRNVCAFSDIRFDFDKATIRPESEEYLDMFVTLLHRFPKMHNASADIIIWGYDNGSRFWVGENWIGRGLLRKSQKEVMLPIVDKNTNIFPNKSIPLGYFTRGECFCICHATILSKRAA